MTTQESSSPSNIEDDTSVCGAYRPADVMFFVTGYRRCDGLPEKTINKSRRPEMGARERSPWEYIGVILFCGICFLILKIFFPGRCFNWYLNRIKLIAAIAIVLLVIISLIKRSVEL